MRQQLLNRLTKRESLWVLDVLSRVSGTLARRFGSLDFRALASLAGTNHAALPAESLPFARIAAPVLQGLGGSYADLAQALSDEISAVPGREDAASPEPEPELLVSEVGDAALADLDQAVGIE